MTLLILINEQSGSVMSAGVDEVERITRKAATDAGREDVEVIRGDALDLIRTAGERTDTEYIAVAGGDGTQAAIAGTLLGSDRTMIPLPCGTMNLLCRDLNIGLDIGDALWRALTGRTIEIDTGILEFDGDRRVFLNNIVFGSYAELAEAREKVRSAETISDLGVGVVAAASAVVNADAVPFQLTLDKSGHGIDTNTIVVSNNAITHSENLIPRHRSLNEGTLAVYLSDARNAGDFASLLTDFVSGGVDESEHLSMKRAEKCIISAGDAMFSFSIDGDPIQTDKAVTMMIRQKGLKIRTAK